MTRFRAGLLISCLACAWFAMERKEVAMVSAAPKKSESEPAVRDFKIDAARAFGYLVKICDIGPRSSGSPGMEKQQKLLVEHFAALGARVKFQSFDTPHPLTQEPVRMQNILVSWHPESADRVLLACHYDTRPFPDEETNPTLRRRPFIGANDGASGVALFMELAHHVSSLNLNVGLDMILFDGEELIFGKVGEFFLGSKHFAEQYRDAPPKHTYRCGVLVDMIGDKNLHLPQERNSLRMAADVTASVWRVAQKLGISAFVNKPGPEVLDDHLPLNEIAHIPTCDIIDFEYPHWHMASDLPRECSGASLAKVGRVLLAWLETLPAKP